MSYYNNTCIARSSKRSKFIHESNQRMADVSTDESVCTVHDVVDNTSYCEVISKNPIPLVSDNRKGKTYVNYARSRTEDNIFKLFNDVALTRVDSTPSSIYHILEHYLPVSYKSDATNGLLFWRLFKRLYYSHYHVKLDRCSYRAFAHLGRQYNHHLSYYEHLCISIWNTNHPQCPLISKNFKWDRNLVHFDKSGNLHHSFQLSSVGSDVLKWNTPKVCATNLGHISSNYVSWKTSSPRIKPSQWLREHRPTNIESVEERLNLNTMEKVMDFNRYLNKESNKTSHVIKTRRVTVSNRLDLNGLVLNRPKADVFDSNRIYAGLNFYQPIIDKVMWLPQDVLNLVVHIDPQGAYYHFNSNPFYDALCKYIHTTKQQRINRYFWDACHFVIAKGCTLETDIQSIFGVVSNETESSVQSVLSKLDAFITESTPVLRTLFGNHMEASSKISDSLDMLEPLKDALNSLAARTGDLAILVESQIQGVGNATIKGINTTFAALTHKNNMIQNTIGKRMAMVIEFLALVFLKNYIPSGLWYTLLAFRACIWFGLDHEILKLMSWISNVISKEFWSGSSTTGVVIETDCQSIGANATTAIATVMFGITSLLTYKQLPQKTNIEKFLKTLDSTFTINRSVEHIPKLIQHIKDMVDKSLCFIFGETTEYEKEAEYLAENADAIKKWAEEVSSLNNEDVYIQLTYDESLRARILILRDKAAYYMKFFEGRKHLIPERLMAAFQINYRDCVDLANRVLRTSKGQEFRYDPYLVYITGKNRSGKSFMTGWLAKRMAKNIGYSDLTNVTYSLCGLKHWDGYTQQRIINIDDLFAVRGQNEEEVVEQFIKMRSNVPWIPPMADVNDKGRPFDSQAVIVSSNIPYPNPNCVAVRNTVLSRRHKLISVKLESGFTLPSGEVDEQKIFELDEQYPNEYRHLKFAFLNPVIETPVDNVDHNLTYAEVEKEILECQLKHHYRQQANIAKFKRVETNCQMATSEYVDSDSEEDTEVVNKVELENDMAIEIVEYLKGDRLDLELDKIIRENFIPNFGLKEPDLEQLKDKTIPARAKAYAQYLFDKFSTPALRIMWWQLRHADILTILEGVQKQCKKAFFHSLRTETGYNAYCDEYNRYRVCFPTIKDKIKKWLEEHPQVKEFLKAMGWASLCTTIIYSGYKLFSFLKGETTLEMSSESIISSGDVKTPKLPKHNVQRHQAHRPTIPTTAQGTSDVNALEIRDNRVINNQWVLIARDRDTKTVKAVINALGLAGHNFLLPYHFFVPLKEGDLIECKGPLTTIHTAYEKSKMIRYGEIDLAVYHSVHTMPMASDFIHLFISDAELKHVKNLSGELVYRSPEQTYYVADTTIKSVEEAGHDAGYYAMEDRFVMRKGWWHTVNTKEGVCGAILIAYDTRLQGKLLGMHVSGKKDQTGGFCVLVTREMVTELFSQIPHKGTTEDTVIQSYLCDRKPAFTLAPEYITLGALKPELSVRMSDKTEIIPTPLFGRIRQPVTQPSVLSPSDPRLIERISPMNKALAKYTVRTIPFNPIHRRAARDYLHSVHMAKIKPLRQIKNITEKEVLNGNPYIAHYLPMDMNSSPGWPYIFKRPAGFVGKRFLFDGDVTDYEMGALLRTNIRSRIQKCLASTKPFSPWTHCLKDERRPNDKILVGNTRIFTMGPVDFNILARFFMLDFIAAYYAAHNTFYSCVGIDPYSPEWEKLYTRLRTKGPRGFDGDYGKFDGTLDADCIMDFKTNVDLWYEHYAPDGLVLHFSDGTQWSFTHQECCLVRYWLFEEMITTYQIVGNTLHMKVQGNPSGNFITVIVNTEVGMQYLVIGYLDIAEMQPVEFKYCSTIQFDKNVEAAIYGDDNQVVPSPEIIHFYNHTTYAKWCERHGMVYTHADKTVEEDIPHKPVMELRFLKCGFNPHPVMGYKMANIDKDTIYELLNWTRKGHDINEITRDNCENALRFAYYWSGEFYQTLRLQINQAILDSGAEILLFADEYDILDRDYLAQFY